MTQNIGQISGLWIGNNPPENNKLIWFDTGNSLHKSYNFTLGQWISMNMNPIVNKTYSELRNLAAHNSISQGTFYRITNLGYLALAITSTKIQYVDNNNNFVIDDLISSKTYCVTSENLLIEDKTGVWDVSTNTLKFNFEETYIPNEASNITRDDYVLGTKVRNGVKRLSKYKISSLLSTVANNALSWNRGFYLNFLTNLQSYYNQNGGVVRYETFDSAISSINSLLTSLQQSINNINIWNKELPNTFSPQLNPTNIHINDTLIVLFNKIQGWIDKFKIANGINLTNDFAAWENQSPISPSDDVDTAMRKAWKWIVELDRILTDHSPGCVLYDIEVIQNRINDNLFPGGLMRVKLKFSQTPFPPSEFYMGFIVSSDSFLIGQESGSTFYQHFDIDIGDGSRADILSFLTPTRVGGAVSGTNAVYDVYSTLRHKSGSLYIQIMMEMDKTGMTDTIFNYQIDGVIFGNNLGSVETVPSQGSILINDRMLITIPVNVPNDITFSESYYIDLTVQGSFSQNV